MKRSLAGAGNLSRAALLLAAAAALTALGADCEGNVVQDPTFRDWCGNSLCALTLDSGRIQRVPTWNPDDFGVAFLDKGTQISQVTQEKQAECLLFTTVADIDPAAQMTLLVDFNNDGVIDFTGPLGATDWHQVQAEISAPLCTAASRFTFEKRVPGPPCSRRCRSCRPPGARPRRRSFFPRPRSAAPARATPTASPDWSAPAGCARSASMTPSVRPGCHANRPYTRRSCAAPARAWARRATRAHCPTTARARRATGRR